VRRILHILKETNPTEALAIISKQAKQPAQELSVILIQEAVRLPMGLPVKVYVLEEDARTRRVTSKFESINYSKMLDLILSSDSVVTW
jgi:sulfur transfer complex TusBCD TusB component (DsrH family)